MDLKTDVKNIATNHDVASIKIDTSRNIKKVVKWEKNRQFWGIALSSFGILISILILLLQIFAWKVKPLTYLLTTVGFFISVYLCVNLLIESRATNKGIERYQEDFKIGQKSIPVFVTKLYLSLQKKQISHKWINFMIVFYGGIFALLLWGLKQLSWQFLDFKTWINNWFSNPDLIIIITLSFLVLVIANYLIFAIQRKKRITDIESFAGQELMNQAQLEKLKTIKNKFYRRMFLISIIIILIIPLFAFVLVKLIRRKK